VEVNALDGMGSGRWAIHIRTNANKNERWMTIFYLFTPLDDMCTQRSAAPGISMGSFPSADICVVDDDILEFEINDRLEGACRLAELSVWVRSRRRHGKRLSVTGTFQIFESVYFMAATLGTRAATLAFVHPNSVHPRIKK